MNKKAKIIIPIAIVALIFILWMANRQGPAEINAKLDYAGIENKFFRYKILNNEGRCKLVDPEQLPKNGDYVTLSCDLENGEKQEKEILIQNLLSDDHTKDAANKAINKFMADAKSCYVLPENIGFSLLGIYPQEDGSVSAKFYRLIFYQDTPRRLLQGDIDTDPDYLSRVDFSEMKEFIQNLDEPKIFEPSAEISGMKTEDLDDFIKDEEGAGFVRVNKE